MLDNLRRRHVVSSQCIRCCFDIETTDHTFFQCRYAQGVWKLSGLSLTLLLDAAVSVEDKLRYLLSLANEDNVPRHVHLLSTWLLWRIWKGRNELLHSKNDLSEQITFSRAKVDIKEWINITRHLSSPAVSTNTADAIGQKWKKSPIEWVKCNFDVAKETLPLAWDG